MFPFILPPLWPAPTLLSSPSFPPISPSLPSHPPLFFITPSLSLNELPSDYWGLWRSIRNMCGGLEAADGKSFVKRLTLISPKEPVGKKNAQWVQRQKLIGFLQDIIFHWMDKQEKTSHPKPLSVKYRSQLENWIIHPLSALPYQSLLLWILACDSSALRLCLSTLYVFDFIQ